MTRASKSCAEDRTDLPSTDDADRETGRVQGGVAHAAPRYRPRTIEAMNAQHRSVPSASRPWREAWHDALYGPDGLYVLDPPHAHFSTATSPGLVTVLADVTVALMRRERLGRFVDMAAGGGELASAVVDLAPDIAVTCVEVRPRPIDVDSRVTWLRSPGGAALPAELHSLSGTLVLAHEWLDNVPCAIAERTGSALHEVCVGPDGTESPGALVVGEQAAWAQRWWPQGGRVEIGAARDDAWADLLSRIEDGLAVAVDYGHLRQARPPTGTLTAYRRGEVVTPVPDGSCDLTAHVAVDSLEHDRLLTQVDLIRELGLVPGPADHDLARTDPAGYLQTLAHRSAVAAMSDPRGLGGFWWVLARRP